MSTQRTMCQWFCPSMKYALLYDQVVVEFGMLRAYNKRIAKVSLTRNDLRQQEYFA